MIPQERDMSKWPKTSQMYIKGSIQSTSKRNTAFRRAPATSEDREKKKSIKLFIFYIFLNNT